MLYVTTRSDADAYTAHHAMTADRAPDGGQFVPRQTPCFDEAELAAAAGRSFSGNIAHVLNLLFGSELTARDVGYVIGERSAHMLDLDSRTMIAELWRGADCSFEETASRLFRLLVSGAEGVPGQWFTQSLRIAMLFAVYAKLAGEGIAMPLDLAVPSFDFQIPMAAWYARAWGLPIGRIICACNENNAPWNLLHLGEMRTDLSVRHTVTAACDQALPNGLERLIHGALGYGEVEKYLTVCKSRGLYELETSQQETIRRGLSVAVISRRRTNFMIPNLYRSGRWNPDPYAAMAYAALCDHRARAGETGKALVIAWEHPMYAADVLADMLTVPAEQLRRRLEKL